VDLAREISHTPGTDSRVEIAMLKQALESKERKLKVCKCKFDHLRVL